MARSGGGHDLVLRRRQEAFLGNLLQPALVVVIRPRLDVDQAATEQAIRGPIALVQEDGSDDGLEGVGQDGLQRARARLVRAFAQQQVVAQAETGGQPGQALGVNH